MEQQNINLERILCEQWTECVQAINSVPSQYISVNTFVSYDAILQTVQTHA
jgi:hypothetical protein